MTRGISAEAFLAGWAERSEMTQEHALEGRVVATCNCAYEHCEGWQLINEKHLLSWRNEQVVIRG